MTNNQTWRLTVVGLAGGFCGALLGHVAVTLILRLGAEFWLVGPHGPPMQFFGIAIYLGLLYGSLGWALSRRPLAFLVGFLGIAVTIALPMAILTHWPQPLYVFLRALAHFPGFAVMLMRRLHVLNPIALAWTIAVLAIYLTATWGTTLALGALLCPGRRLRGAILAVLGSWGGTLILKAFTHFIPSSLQGRWNPMSFIPAPLDLLTGLLIGAGMGAGIGLARWNQEGK